MTDKATPRPWRLSTDRVINAAGLLGPDGECVCIAIKSEKSVDDFALIVRAVNAHDALIAACEAALNRMTMDGYQESHVGGDALTKLLAALALAKEAEAKEPT